MTLPPANVDLIDNSGAFRRQADHTRVALGGKRLHPTLLERIRRALTPKRR